MHILTYCVHIQLLCEIIVLGMLYATFANQKASAGGQMRPQLGIRKRFIRSLSGPPLFFSLSPPQPLSVAHIHTFLSLESHKIESILHVLKLSLLVLQVSAETRSSLTQVAGGRGGRIRGKERRGRRGGGGEEGEERRRIEEERNSFAHKCLARDTLHLTVTPYSEVLRRSQ